MSLITSKNIMLMTSAACTSEVTATATLDLHAYKVSVGEHGEVALDGEGLTETVDNTVYLRLAINGNLYRTVLHPWDPSASGDLTFARHAHLTAVQALLDATAAVPNGPLTTARKIYLLAMTLAMAWLQASPPATGGASVTGQKDTWNFDVRYGVPNGLSPTDAAIWFVHAVTQLVPAIVPAFNVKNLLTEQRSWFHWTVEQQVSETTRVCTLNNWTAFKSAYDTWFAYRAADGFSSPAAGAYVATSADIPNIATPLVVAGTSNPPGNEQWTPLTVPAGSTQKYLGYKWSEVVSTCLTAQDMSAMLDVAAPLFPDAAARTAEVAEVKDITAALSDSEKIIAELWAGGPFTCTPPGQFAWLWKDFMQRQIGANLHVDSSFAQVNTQVLSCLDLSVGLFEGSRVIWSVKTHYTQSRPIQEIRHRYYGTSILSWNSASAIAGESWIPYQMDNFVTPPFADFSSGHSYFSRTFAQCMTYWFGNDIPALPVLPISKNQLQHLSPLFNNLQTSELELPYATFVVGAGYSEIQPGVVPTSTVTLSFTTWNELATQVGMSRLYGGIHCISAHNGSVAVSNALYPVLQSRWQIEKVVE